jgi:hypothetical protein
MAAVKGLHVPTNPYVCETVGWGRPAGTGAAAWPHPSNSSATWYVAKTTAVRNRPAGLACLSNHCGGARGAVCVSTAGGPGRGARRASEPKCEGEKVEGRAVVHGVLHDVEREARDARAHQQAKVIAQVGAGDPERVHGRQHEHVGHHKERVRTRRHGLCLQQRPYRLHPQRVVEAVRSRPGQHDPLPVCLCVRARTGSRARSSRQ